jgi:hypothetical protein
MLTLYRATVDFVRYAVENSALRKEGTFTLQNIKIRTVYMVYYVLHVLTMSKKKLQNR